MRMFRSVSEDEVNSAFAFSLMFRLGHQKSRIVKRLMVSFLADMLNGFKVSLSRSYTLISVGWYESDLTVSKAS